MEAVGRAPDDHFGLHVLRPDTDMFWDRASAVIL